MTHLRPHQTQAVDALRDAFRSDHRRVIVQAPTGAGKGTVIAHVAAMASAQGPVLVVAHLGEILRDLRGRILEEGAASVRLLMGDTDEGPDDAAVIVASLQTLEARSITVPDLRLLLVDEAHRVACDGYQALLERHPDARVAGFTATPARADGAPLVGFTHLVQGPQILDLVALGLLAPATLLSPTEHVASLAQDPVEVYPAGRPGIIFARSLSHSRDIAAGLAERGVRAAHVDADTDDRDTLVSRFNGGELDVLVCYRLLVEGVDVPRAEVCCLASPVSSPVSFLQAIGRVRRPGQGKRALVLDLHGSWHLHGGPDEARTYHLDGQAIRVATSTGGAGLTQCPGCLSWGVPRSACDECGHTRPAPPPPRVLARDLVEVRAQESESARYATLRRFVRDAVSKGWKPGAAIHRYKGTFGHYPPRGWLEAAMRGDEAAA